MFPLQFTNRFFRDLLHQYMQCLKQGLGGSIENTLSMIPPGICSTYHPNYSEICFRLLQEFQRELLQIFLWT